MTDHRASFATPVRGASRGATAWRPGPVRRTRWTHAIAVASAALVWSTGAWAGKPENVTPDEMALLPPYCVDVQGFQYGDASYNTSPNAPKWLGMMGRGFWAVHHYCWALINLGRILRPSVPPEIKRGERDGAIGDMYYVINNVPPDFVILPEIYAKIGEIQLEQKRAPQARQAYEKARALKPDYWPAYYQWAEYLRRSGQKDQARTLVEEGLAKAPESKSLQRLLVELGGSLASVPPRAESTDPARAASPAP